MAREIHDELGQQLTALKMEISWLHRNLQRQDETITSKIDSSVDLINETINSVRKIATQLRPSILDDLGLTEAIDWQGSEFSKHTGIIVQFHSNVQDIKFPAAISIALFRVYQEALTNVARHARATLVTCTLEVKNSSLYLVITDDGTGFNIRPEAKQKTLGLLGMQERIEMLQGVFTIDSCPGKGTTVSVIIPLS